MDLDACSCIPYQNRGDLCQGQCLYAKYAANSQGKYACMTVKRWLPETMRRIPLMPDKIVALATLVYASAAFSVQLAANQRKQK